MYSFEARTGKALSIVNFAKNEVKAEAVNWLEAETFFYVSTIYITIFQNKNSSGEKPRKNKTDGRTPVRRITGNPFYNTNRK